VARHHEPTPQVCGRYDLPRLARLDTRARPESISWPRARHRVTWPPIVFFLPPPPQQRSVPLPRRIRRFGWSGVVLPHGVDSCCAWSVAGRNDRYGIRSTNTYCMCGCAGSGVSSASTSTAASDATGQREPGFPLPWSESEGIQSCRNDKERKLCGRGVERATPHASTSSSREGRALPRSCTWKGRPATSHGLRLLKYAPRRAPC
jgi:hypothetical protein